MTFFILRSDADDELPLVIAKVTVADDLPQALRDAGEGAFISERLTWPVGDFRDPRKIIPPELDRAIDAWNKVAARRNLPAVRQRGSYVAPYRRWKKQVGDRDWLLESLMPLVDRCPFMWTWIKFGWLFGGKNGDMNSDKVLSKQMENAGLSKDDLAMKRMNAACRGEYT